MTAARQLRRGAEPERFKIVPPRRVVYRKAVLVAENDPGAFENAPDGGIELAGHLRLVPPDGLEDRRHVARRNLIDRPWQQRPAVGRPEVAFPLIGDLGVARPGLRLCDHIFSNIGKGRDRPRRLPGFFPRRQRVNALRDFGPGGERRHPRRG